MQGKPFWITPWSASYDSLGSERLKMAVSLQSAALLFGQGLDDHVSQIVPGHRVLCAGVSQS